MQRVKNGFFVMKRISIVFTLFWVVAFYGCSTTNVNSNSNILPTCAANPISEKESQEKQCCLKDSLETEIKYVEEVCMQKDSVASNDSVSSEASSDFSINPTLSINLNKNNKVQTELNCNNNSIDSQAVCSNVNNIFVETGNSGNDKRVRGTPEFYKEYFKVLQNGYVFLIIFVILVFTYIRVYFLLVLRKIGKKIIAPKVLATYDALTPTENADISVEMSNQLMFAVTNNQIKNIAITGPYGSGKSSIWRTFCSQKKIDKIKNIAYISLAKFNPQSDKKKVDNELEIEKAVIQQLIYSKKKSDLKYSNISRIRNLRDIDITLITVPCFLFISLLLPIISESIFNILNIFLEQECSYVELICGGKTEIVFILFFLTILYAFIFFAIQKINKIKISKICLKEIEISLGEGESLFNKYLDEIVYFFEATKCNCVVIEDLDRFDSSLEIFSKLRDLNGLINNHPGPNNRNLNVQFIYFVKDEIFYGLDRTKFFDYIIPAVPALSFSNSAKILKSLADKYHFCLDESFLKNIQKYLNDYRLVKNCINESLIYKNENRTVDIKEEQNENLENQKEDDVDIQQKINQKIFSLVLYKNLYPKDFSELMEKQGVLFKCLNEFKYEQQVMFDANDVKLISGSADGNNVDVPIKNLLEEHPEARGQLIKYIKKLVYEEKYEEHIDADLVLCLLTNGYIEKDYEYYIFKKDNVILDKDEQTFVFNVANNIPKSLNLSLKQDHLEIIVKDEIQDCQWNSLGVLNNDIIDYILRKSLNAFSYATKIVQAMYSFDKLQQSKNIELKHFIPQYFIHCDKEKNKINYEPILQAVANFIVTVNDIEKSKEILVFFFSFSNTKIFFKFLYVNVFGRRQISEYVKKFLDEKKVIRTIFSKRT